LRAAPRRPKIAAGGQGGIDLEDPTSPACSRPVRRRDLIAWALAAPVAARASAQGQPRIAILHSGFPERTAIHLLFAEFARLGYENGRGAVIELLGGQGEEDRLRGLVARLAAERPDAIVAVTSPAARALKEAGIGSPVVFGFITDPVGLGLVATLAHPGANFTGVTYSDALLGGKRLDLLLDALPGTRRIAVLWSRSFPETAALFESIRLAGRAREVEIISREHHGPGDLAAAFGDAKRAGAQAAIFLTDNLMFGYRKDVAEAAIANRLPSMHSFYQEAEDGGFMSYGPSAPETYARIAALVDRILKGARPAELPVEEPTRFTLAVNLKTAAALGLAIPPALLARADEVFE
jgi:putative ABC transport system substrate-binding protein